MPLRPRLLPFVLLFALFGTPAAFAAGADELTAYAREVEAKIAAGDPNALDLDLGLLLETSTRDIEAPRGFRDAFLAGAKKGAGAGLSNALSKQLAQVVKDGGTVKLLRVRSPDRKPRALYRILHDAGVNYLDLHLGQDAQGKVTITDCYMFLAGETVGSSLRRMYVMGVAEANRGLLDKLMGKEQEFFKNAPKLHQMGQLIQQKKYAESLAIFDSLPASMKKEKLFLLARFNAASSIDDEKIYQRAIEDFEAAHPEDPALDLLAIDGHFLRKNYDAVLEMVERLYRRVRDPYLHVLRGSAYLQKKDDKSARDAFSEAMKEEPTLADPYWNLIALAMQDKNWKETARLLTAVERDAGVQVNDDLSTVDEYKAFAKTAEYRAWKKARASRRD